MALWNAFVLFLEQILLTFYTWTGSSGIAIILFTIVARLVILPLTFKGLQSSRKLYREYKINPAGGCLPIFLQLPIFLGVYQAVINLTRVSPAEHAGGAMIKAAAAAGMNIASLPVNLGQPQLAGGFLWLTDLGKVDSLYILPVLSVIFQLIVQLMATPRVQDPQQKVMTQTMLVMPIVFGYIGFTFPSGAVLYWVVGSILSMIQQYVISGWGSLANYLKFLPTTGGLFPPLIPATAGATAGGTSSGTEDSAEVKRDFWDVLAPLRTETAVNSAAAVAAVEVESAVEEKYQPAPANPRKRKARK
jgi:YidC/Oxa1 family membrane protein insertase